MNDRTIRKTFKRTSIITFVLLSCVGAILIFYQIKNMQYDQLEKNSSESVRLVNTMVSSLNRIIVMCHDSQEITFTNFSDSSQVRSELAYFNEQKEEFLKKTAHLGFDFSTKSIGEFPKWTFQNKTPTLYLNHLGEMARAINANKDETHETIRFISDSMMIVSFAILAFIFVVLLTSYLSQKRFFKTVDKTIEGMKKIIDDEQNPDELNHAGLEASQMYAKVKEIGKKVKFQKELLRQNNFGMLESVLPEKYDLLKSQLNIQRLAVAFMDHKGNVIAESLKSEKPKVFLHAGFTEPLNETSLKDLNSEDDVRIINDLEDHYNNVSRSEFTKRIIDEGFKSSIAVPMYTHTGLLGFIFANNDQKNAFDEADKQTLRLFSKTLKSEIYNAYLMQEIIAKTSAAFADLVEKKDFETGTHLSRVAEYSRLMASKLMEYKNEITPKMLREIYWYAPLHDIGKVGIPDKVLLKPGKLTAKEFEIMKTHVDTGVQIIHNMNETLIRNTGIHFLDTCINIIGEHHEKWDGTGYPKGLKGEEISIPGRIVAISDVFDALISQRVYKPAFSLKRAFEIIEEGKGKHFCPGLVDIFLDSKDEIIDIVKRYGD